MKSSTVNTRKKSIMATAVSRSSNALQVRQVKLDTAGSGLRSLGRGSQPRSQLHSSVVHVQPQHATTDARNSCSVKVLVGWCCELLIAGTHHYESFQHSAASYLLGGGSSDVDYEYSSYLNFSPSARRLAVCFDARP